MAWDVGRMCEAIFLGEDAPISTTMSHFGFNKSPLLMRNSLEAIDFSVRYAGIEAGSTIATAAFAAREVTFTSLSEAV